jgi:hypothetical protein
MVPRQIRETIMPVLPNLIYSIENAGEMVIPPSIGELYDTQGRIDKFINAPYASSLKTLLRCIHLISSLLESVSKVFLGVDTCVN